MSDPAPSAVVFPSPSTCDHERLHLKWVPSRPSHGDYRDVAGIKVPFTWTASQTHMQMTVKLTDIAPNVPVEAARFLKPPRGMAKR